jgi:predicted ATPase/DNA-binding winged helix-turn-helix (wHTH) protein
MRDQELSTHPPKKPAEDVSSFGRFCLSRTERLLECDRRPVQLGSRAFDILSLLLDRAGDVVSKADLMARAWPGLTVEESSLRFHITQLRRALGEERGGENFVLNVPGRGYCFVASVSQGKPTTGKPSVTKPMSGRSGHDFPPKPSRLIGRDREIAALAANLAEHRFITLRGPGGVGKTTVAIALAHEVGHRFADGVRFVDLGVLRDERLVAGTVASVLGVVVPVGDPTPRLLETLRDKELLLILDNCEHVIDAAAHLAEQIYGYAPKSAILATSRETLEVAREFVVELPPLDVPPTELSVETDVASYSSARLFIECATAAGCDASQLTCDAEIVARLCGRLDGVPLAIELVASRLSTHTLVELDELIESRLRLAWPGRRTAPLRHQSLSAAMDWSYDLVSSVERTLLQYFSVFPGLFTLDGVRALADGLAERDAVLWVLEQLVAKSLVTSRVSAGQARFRLLETTRAYASEKLASSGAAHAANMSHARYVLNALTPRSYEPGGERPGGWLHRSELLADTRASLGWAFSDAGEPSLRMPLAAVAARLFVEMNLLEECRSWSGRALTIAASGGDHKAAEIDLLWAFGHASMFSDRNSQECEAALRRGLEMAQELDDLQNQFRLLSRLHALYRRTGERERLLEVSQLADIVATKLGDPASAGRAHTYLGIAYHLLGDQRAARERLEKGEAIDAEIPFLPIDHFAYPRGTNVMSCTNLWLIGRLDRAVAVANGLMDARANPDLAMYCAGLCFAARVYRFVGDTDALEEAANRLAGYSRKHGLGPFQTAAQALKGELNVARGAVDEGVDVLRRSIPRMLAERLELYSGAASLALVDGLAAQGRFDDALASLQVRIDHVASQGDSWEMPELLRVRGELRWHIGAEPDVDLLAACELAERQSALSWKLRVDFSRFRLADASFRRQRASDLRATYSRFSEGLDTADLRAVRSALDQFDQSLIGVSARNS